MGRIKKNQNIDSLIQGIKTIAENQCSLSEQDLIVLNEVLKSLQLLKQKKGATNEQILDEVVKVIGHLNRFLFQDGIDDKLII